MKGSGDLRRTTALFRRFAAGQRATFLVALLLLALEAVTAIFTAVPLAYFVDLVSGRKPPLSVAPSLTATIGVLAVALVALTAVNSLADSLAEIALARGGRTLGYNLRVALFGHLQKLSLAFHARRHTGDVLTRITGDVQALEDFVVQSVSDLAGSVLLLAGTIAFLFRQSWQLTLLALSTLPLLGLVSNVFARRIKVASKQLRAREGDLATNAQEMLTSIGVVQTYGRGGYEERRFADRSRAAMDAVLHTARLEAAFSFTVSVLQALVIAAMMWVGAVVIGLRTISAGLLVLFVTLTEQMFKPTRRIIKEWNTVGKIYASVERIADLLDRRPAVQDSPDAVETPPLAGRIEFRDVSFAYQPGPDEDPDAPQRLALDSVSFTIEPGEVVALVGQSGAGKSTIAQLLPRLYDPHQGAVLLDGYDARELTVESLRAQISMVLQETVLFSGSVAENIAYGRDGATWDDVFTAAKLANAHDFITAMPQGYETVLGERAATLSGGQRQRLAIARAFVRDAPILILDEPTTGLDAESSELVLSALETLVRGKTAVIISHDLNLMRVADRLLVISAGRIIEEGTAADLLARGGLYAQLHARQFGEAAARPPARVPVAAGAAPAPYDGAPAPYDGAPAPYDGEGGGEADASPGGRRAFETVLMQAVPLPASPEAFRLLTGHLPPTVRREQRGVDHAPDGREKPPASAAVPHPRPATDPELDALQVPALGRAMPGLAEALDPATMTPVIAGMLREGWEPQWCTPGKALVEPDGTGATLRYDVGLRDPVSGQVSGHLVGGRIFLDEDAADDWVRTRLAPLDQRAAARTDLEPFRRRVQLVRPLRLVLHAFPLDADLPGLLDATDPARMQEVLGATLERPIPDLALERCRPHVVQYARRGRCVLRYEVHWRLGASGRSLKQVVYGKAYADDQGAGVGPAVTAVRSRVQAGSGGGFSFLVPRFQGYLPDLRLSLLEALPGTPQVAGLVREWVTGAPAGEHGGLTLEHALETCARITATLHACDVRPATSRTFAGELAAARAQVAAIEPYAPVLAGHLAHRLEALSPVGADAPPRIGFAHGDMTPAQVLFDGSLSGLVDFDTSCMADPALDLGQFTGYLELAVVKARVGAGREAQDAGDLTSAFLGDYARFADCGDLDALVRRVAAYRTVTLARVAVRSWQQLKPRRVEVALTALEQQQPSAAWIR